MTSWIFNLKPQTGFASGPGVVWWTLAGFGVGLVVDGVLFFTGLL